MKTTMKALLAGAAVLAMTACTQLAVEYETVGDGVRALSHPGEAEPFRYEMQVNNSVRWYEATPVGDHFVLTTRGRVHYAQDEMRPDWDMP
ncbi:MAG: hypothetical protein H6843_11230 [Rhodospirillaceae bacterium]|nr:hypothetical protein [Rhodospirillaceae bacterium]